LARAVRTSIARASTFPGLCADHDARLWRPIDAGLSVNPTDEELFLLSYRAILKELYTARWSCTQLKKTFRIVLDRRAPKNAAAFALAHLMRAHWGARRCARIAAWYRAQYEEKRYATDLVHLTGRNLWLLPFAVSSYFEPVFQPDGTRVPPGVGPGVGPFITLNVLPRQEGSLIVLAYPFQFRETLHPLLNQLRPPIGEQEFVERTWEMVLRYCENIVLAPRYWSAVPTEVQDAILSFYNADPHRFVPSPGPAISLFDWIERIPPEEARARLGI
jgi:hypothetical protein